MNANKIKNIINNSKSKIYNLNLKAEYLTNSLNEINGKYREMVDTISLYKNKIQLIVGE